MQLPAGLERAILDGRCVAFVGAGFAMPYVPSWRELLDAVARHLGRDVPLAKDVSAFTLEATGQILQDVAKAAGRDWHQLVGVALDDLARDATRRQARAGLDRRRALLMSIPFRAILTTNFDASLTGRPITPESYRGVLREELAPGWQLPDQLDGDRRTPPVIKLHGCVTDPAQTGLVFSRSDYRALVHRDGRYPNFIRSVFAGYTLLFLGVSFTDAYLNELRSEILTLLAPKPDGEPWGYALRLGTEPDVAAFFRHHEAIEILPTNAPEDFDAWLAEIAARTSVTGRMRALLAGKRVVWVDADHATNDRGARFLRDECGADVIALDGAHALTDAHRGAELVLSSFGYAGDGPALAYRVLEHVNRWPERPPVIVFAAPGAPDQLRANRRSCLRRGAFEYATRWSELYRLIESLFRVPGAA